MVTDLTSPILQESAVSVTFPIDWRAEKGFLYTSQHLCNVAPGHVKFTSSNAVFGMAKLFISITAGWQGTATYRTRKVRSNGYV